MDGKRLASMSGAVLIVAGAAALVVLSRRRADTHPAAAAASIRHDGLDWATAPLDVMFTTADANTPCETAYNAMRAGQDAAAARNKAPLFAFLAGRDAFLAACNQMPPEARPCAVPRYARDHRDACVKMRPPSAVLDQMYKANPDYGGVAPVR